MRHACLCLLKAAVIAAATESAALSRLQGGLDVFVVEQHGDVLEHWPSSLAKPLAHGPPTARASGKPWQGTRSFAAPLALVHVDSHSDLMEIQPPLDGWGSLLRRVQKSVHSPQEAAWRRPRWQMEAADLVQIGDFITAALWLGLVDEVIWLQSDFPESKSAVYNGPQPGKYLVDLAQEPEGEASIAHSSFDERRQNDATGEFSLCFRIVHTWWEWPLAELRGTEDVGDFHSCRHMPQGGSRPRRFNLTVATMDQMLHLLEHGTPWDRHARAERKPWVLDVDLDFFASYDPSYELFLARGFTERFARTLTTLLHTNGTCSRRAPRGSTPDQHEIRAGLFRFVHALPDSLASFRGAPCRAEAVRTLLKKADPATAACELGPIQAMELCEIVVGLNPAARRAWASVFDPVSVAPIAEDLSLSIFQNSPGPHFATAGEVRRSMALFGRFLNYTAQGALGDALNLEETPPLVVTVARSMCFDRYLPEEFWPMVEHGMNDALFMAFGHLNIHYGDGIRPLPSGRHLGTAGVCS